MQLRDKLVPQVVVSRVRSPLPMPEGSSAPIQKANQASEVEVENGGGIQANNSGWIDNQSES